MIIILFFPVSKFYLGLTMNPAQACTVADKL